MVTGRQLGVPDNRPKRLLDLSNSDIAPAKVLWVSGMNLRRNITDH
jgi:hypothetical protein